MEKGIRDASACLGMSCKLLLLCEQISEETELIGSSDWESGGLQFGIDIARIMIVKGDMPVGDGVGTAARKIELYKTPQHQPATINRRPLKTRSYPPAATNSIGTTAEAWISLQRQPQSRTKQTNSAL